MLIDRSIARVRAYFAEAGMSKEAFAKKAGLGGESTVRGINDPGWSPNAETLRKLEAIIPPEFQLPDEAPAEDAA